MTLPTIDEPGRCRRLLKGNHTARRRPVHPEVGATGSEQVHHAGRHGGLAQRELLRPHRHRRIRSGGARTRLRGRAARGGPGHRQRWEAALKNSLRQAYDVILMGEIRDREAMGTPWPSPRQATCAAARCASSSKALDRIVNFFPEGGAPAAHGPSLNLKASGYMRRLVPQQVRAARLRRGHARFTDRGPVLSGRSRRNQGDHEEPQPGHLKTFDQSLFDLFEATSSATRMRRATPIRSTICFCESAQQPARQDHRPGLGRDFRHRPDEHALTHTHARPPPQGGRDLETQ